MRREKTFELRLSLEELQRLKELSKRMGIPKSEVVRTGLELLEFLLEEGIPDELGYKLYKKGRHSLLQKLLAGGGTQ